jgi:hypothetical protein
VHKARPCAKLLSAPSLLVYACAPNPFNKCVMYLYAVYMCVNRLELILHVMLSVKQYHLGLSVQIPAALWDSSVEVVCGALENGVVLCCLILNHVGPPLLQTPGTHVLI